MRVLCSLRTKTCLSLRGWMPWMHPCSKNRFGRDIKGKISSSRVCCEIFKKEIALLIQFSCLREIWWLFTRWCNQENNFQTTPCFFIFSSAITLGQPVMRPQKLWMRFPNPWVITSLLTRCVRSWGRKIARSVTWSTVSRSISRLCCALAHMQTPDVFLVRIWPHCLFKKNAVGRKVIWSTIR